jgi:hypothetical protein
MLQQSNSTEYPIGGLDSGQHKSASDQFEKSDYAFLKVSRPRDGGVYSVAHIASVAGGYGVWFGWITIRDTKPQGEIYGHQP